MAELEEGAPWPLGATVEEGGVNFAVFSAHADAMELCLFDEAGEERRRLALPAYTDEVFHGFLPKAEPGLHYGLRAHGPWAPEAGHRFNPAKLLLDPWATRWSGPLRYDARQLGHDQRGGPNVVDRRDSAPTMPRCVVEAPAPAPLWKRPATPARASIFYELHVKGFSQRRLDVDKAARGAIEALSEPAIIDHFRALGVSALEMMPLQAFCDEPRLAAMGLSNYWGYNTIGFFVPEPRRLGRYGASGLALAIEDLHDAGIEAILDVVYNHTGEGDEFGPTLSFRGLDNRSYYRLLDEDPSRYDNPTGTGNALDVSHPRVVELILASLRHWRSRYGFDGFRFDLATTLMRDRKGAVDDRAPLLHAIARDPELRGAKLIAEPWDIGPGGYGLGAMPPGFFEWNDRFRDATRRFWRGDPGAHRDFAARLLGSPDVFDRRGRKPWASVDFVTAHDGFTLADLVSYERKRNEANGEGDRDGHGENFSWNNGVEGPSDDPSVRAARLQDRANLLTTLLIGKGTPMLSMGDELGHTQQGNNNAYCQDNEVSWIDWPALAPEDDLTELVGALCRLRRESAIYRRSDFRHGAPLGADAQPDISWLRLDGAPMATEDWERDDLEGFQFVLREEDECVVFQTNRGRAPLPAATPESDPPLALIVDSADQSEAERIQARSCRVLWSRAKGSADGA